MTGKYEQAASQLSSFSDFLKENGFYLIYSGADICNPNQGIASLEPNGAGDRQIRTYFGDALYTIANKIEGVSVPVLVLARKLDNLEARLKH